MVKQDTIYKCGVCGNVVSVIEAHEGTLSCCGQKMVLLEEKTAKMEGKEKHVPVIEIKAGKVTVKVGSIPHPMEDGHWIELVQLLRKGKVIAEQRLYPGNKPDAEFCLKDTAGITARELCNIHGLWKSA
jgi:superoxide reductase